MITAVVGSRRFTGYSRVKYFLDHLDPAPTKIVSGGAKGVDTLAYKYAMETGIVFNGFPPSKEDKELYGYARACYRRNTRIVAACDRLIAFPCDKSKGTWHSVGLAKKLGKEVQVIKVEVIEI